MWRAILAGSLALACATPAARAGMLGDAVHGELTFPALSGDTNLFDPANGLVPREGASAVQPQATVIDPDPDFPEFHMFAPSSAQGLRIDIDERLITVEWYAQDRVNVEWVGHRIVLSDLDFGDGSAIGDVVQLQNDASARVSFDGHGIAIETDHYDVVSHATKSSWLILSLRTTVPNQAKSWSQIKSLYH